MTSSLLQQANQNGITASTFNEAIHHAQNALAAMELPSRSDERFRKIDLSGIDFSRFLSETAETELSVRGEGFDVVRDEALYADRTLAHALLSDLAAEDYFAMMNLARVQKWVYIKAQKNSRIEIDHRAVNGSSNIASVHHRVLIEVPDLSEVTVIERFYGSEGIETLWNCDTTLSVARGAKVAAIHICDFAPNDHFFNRIRSSLRKDAKLHDLLIHAGGRSGKTTVGSVVHEEGANYRGTGIGVGSGRQFADIEMGVEHRANHSDSSLLYRAVLQGRAHSVFTGSLLIPKGLRDVNSHQTNNNILIGERARAESIPKLLIQSEHVRCNHGATIGQIDSEALLYLQSRGIPENEAKLLLVEGFVVEMLEQIAVPELRDEVFEDLMHRKLAL